MRPLVLVRPEPALSASLKRAHSMGLEAVACPLFRIEPVDWIVPEPAGYDALLLTSANAVRNAGTGLQQLRQLPVHAVGSATAKAAVRAGLTLASVGEAGVEELLSGIPDSSRLLHLAGEHRRPRDNHANIDTCIVYRSVAVDEPGLPGLEGALVAVHSPRAGKRLAALVSHRKATIIVAISESAAAACGLGWERIEVAERPDDTTMLALAAMLCQTSAPR